MPAHRRPAPRARDDAGLSLIEVIVAITVFGLVAAGVASMLMTGVSASRHARDRTAAAAVASEALEKLRSQGLTSYSSLSIPSSSTQPYTVGGQAFSATTTLSWAPKFVPAAACDATNQGGSSAVAPVVLAKVAVTWTRMDGAAAVTDSTTFKPPINAYPNGTGGLDMKVVGASGQGVPSVPVTVATTGYSQTVTTDAYGCAFAAYLPPGSYSVTASAAGYVDDQESATSTKTTVVSSGMVQMLTFTYDRAVSFTASFSPPSPPPATGLPISVGASGLAGTGFVTFPSGTMTLSPLFPYATNRVFAGRCTDADPTRSGATYAVVGAPTAGTAAVAVPLYPVTITVTQNGNPISGAAVTATETSTSCTQSSPPYGLSTTDAAGRSVTGLPLGQFAVTVTSGPKTGTVTVTVTPTGATGTVVL